MTLEVQLSHCIVHRSVAHQERQKQMTISLLLTLFTLHRLHKCKGKGSGDIAMPTQNSRLINPSTGRYFPLKNLFGTCLKNFLINHSHTALLLHICQYVAKR